MTIWTIIFAWLFFNTWATLLAIKLTGQFITDWSEYASVLMMAVVSPFPFLLFGWVHGMIKKHKRTRGK